MWDDMQYLDGDLEFYKWARFFGDDSVEARMCKKMEQSIYRNHGGSAPPQKRPKRCVGIAVELTVSRFAASHPTYAQHPVPILFLLHPRVSLHKSDSRADLNRFFARAAHM